MFLNDENKWNEIRTNEAYLPIKKRILQSYEENCKGQTVPTLTFALETEILKNGNRTHFESVYFAKRKQMTAYALMALLYPEEEAYMHGLEEVIYSILSEYSWQLPAHRPAEQFNLKNGIALFAAETGLYLAEIKAIFKDRLNPLLTERITDELKTRIMDSFLTNEGWFFENVDSNWAAVCAGCMGSVFLYEAPNAYLKIKPRIEKCMQNYLGGCSEDGGTPEGGAYWNYGFTFYVLFYDLLRRHVYHRINYFDNDKVRKLAGFYSSLCLDNENLVSFSDCGGKISYDLWIAEFVNREYGVPMPPTDKGVLQDSKFSSAIRACIYYVPRETESKPEPMKHYYENLCWYIERKQAYSFAVKGGNNAESHNHNDIGSFMVVCDGNVIFTDLGAPEYTDATFGKDAYKKILNKSSLGHSVPIINGEAQKFGSAYYGTMEVGEDSVTVDMTHAYPVRTEQIQRNFVLSENKMVLRDSVKGAKTITERFVTEIEPVINSEKIMVGNVCISVDTKYNARLSHEDIYASDGVTVRRVYKLDFEVCDDMFEMELCF